MLLGLLNRASSSQMKVEPPPAIDFKSLTPEEQLAHFEKLRAENYELRKSLKVKDETISGLRVRIFTLNGQLAVQRKLLDAELKKNETKTSELANSIVKDTELDHMTQNWLATEFVNPGHNTVDSDSEEGEDEPQTDTGEPAPNTLAPSNVLPNITEEPKDKAEPTDITIAVAPMSARSLHKSSEPASDTTAHEPDGKKDEDEKAPETASEAQINSGGAQTSSEQKEQEKPDKSNEVPAERNEAEKDHPLANKGMRALKTSYSLIKSRRKLFSMSFSTEIRPQVPADILGHLRSEHFDLFTKSIDELKKCIVYMFEDLDLLKAFMIKPSTLSNFIDHMALEYRDNPYHNFFHAVDVSQTVYYYITKTNAREILQPLDILALMVSAISHDVGHPGQNNAFQISTQTELARIYNDISVLESHHAAKTFEVMRRYEYPSDEISKNPSYYIEYLNKKRSGEYDIHPKNTNILQGLTTTQFKDARKNILNMILSTDMAKHFEMTAKLSQLSKKAETEEVVLSPDKKEDRDFLCAVMLHCADISNVTKPFDIGKVWSDRVRDEFFNQGDLEKAYGLPVSPFMDREDSNQARSTLNFIDFIATPLFTSLSIMVNGLQDTCQNLLGNRQRWQEILEMNLTVPPKTEQSVANSTNSNPNKVDGKAENKDASSNQNTEAKEGQFTAEKEKEIYRRRSFITSQQLKQADDIQKRRLSRGPSNVLNAASSAKILVEEGEKEQAAPKDTKQDTKHSEEPTRVAKKESELPTNESKVVKSSSSALSETPEPVERHPSATSGVKSPDRLSSKSPIDTSSKGQTINSNSTLRGSKKASGPPHNLAPIPTAESTGNRRSDKTSGAHSSTSPIDGLTIGNGVNSHPPALSSSSTTTTGAHHAGPPSMPSRWKPEPPALNGASPSRSAKSRDPDQFSMYDSPGFRPPPNAHSPPTSNTNTNRKNDKSANSSVNASPNHSRNGGSDANGKTLPPLRNTTRAKPSNGF